jgi:hypothetical protein
MAGKDALGHAVLFTQVPQNGLIIGCRRVFPQRHTQRQVLPQIKWSVLNLMMEGGIISRKF